MFPEGDHHLNRRVRPLNKGFTRIIFGALKKYKDLEIYIVPVGLNYDTHISYPQSVSIYYGKAFLANNYYNEDDLHRLTKQLVTKTSDELKLLTTHIGDLETYDSKILKLEALNADFLNPIDTNKLLQKLEGKSKSNKINKADNFWFKLVYIIALASI